MDARRSKPFKERIVPFNINTNITSLQAQDYLRQSSDFQGKTINRVTSGLRIISSGDDAAGLAIANGYRSDQAVLTQGVRNANDGLSQLQIADGGINNISKLLDRARTLATQSASGAFTGDRSLLNSEFQSVIGEIDRQAQVVGLNTNGTFARSLAVFIGGGKESNGISATNNGSINLDLSASTVDSKSLGLKGVQAVGKASTDIGSGSATTKVSDIVGNTNNINSQATAGFADFYFRGPGFGDSNRIKVSVNLAGVTDTGTLVTAINSAIAAAGNGGSQAATAFKNAAVTVGVNVDATGKSQLTFNSSIAAFQVEAGDKTSNGLLGNFNGGGPEGAALTTTVTSAAATAAGSTTFGATGAGNVVFRISGSGLSSPVDVTLTTTTSETVNQAITDLSSQVANNSALKGAGISLTSAIAGSQLAFTGTHGEKFAVEVTGDATNKLGFGSFLKGNSQEFDYATLTAGSSYSTASAGTQTLELSLNGQASSGHSIALNLSAGDATAAAVTGNTHVGTLNITNNNNQVNLTVNGTSYQVNLTANGTSTLNDIANQINTVITANGTATVNSSNQLVITSNTKGAAGSIQVETGTANTDLGLSAGLTAGVSRSGADLANALNQSFASDAALQAAGLKADFGVTSAGKLTISSTNNTNFRVDSRGTTTAATTVGSASFTTGGTAGLRAGSVAGTYNITSTNNIVSFKIDGGATQNISLAQGGTRTAAQVAADINASITGGVASVNGSGFVQIASSTTGAGSSVQFLAASVATSGVVGGSINGPFAIDGGTAGVSAGSINGPFLITGATNDVFSVKIDGGATQSVTLTAGAARTAAQIVADINATNGGAGLFGATASVVGGKVTVTSNAIGTGSSVQFVASANTVNATVGFVTTLQSGTAATNNVLSVKVDGGTSQQVTLTAGAARTAAQIVTDINNSNGGAGLSGATASVVSGKVTITSNTTGVASSIQFDVNGTSTVNTTIGVNTTAVAGINAVDSSAATLGLTAGTTTGTASATQLTITTGSNDKLSITVDGGSAQVVTLTGGGLRTAAQVVTDINAVLLTSATASADANGHIKIVSASTGTGSSIAFNAVANDAYTTLGLSVGTTTGNAGDAGYGVLGATFSGNTVSAAPATSVQVDAGGSSQSSSFAFTPVLYGSDAQTISITANNGSGAQQSQSITLKNDNTSRSGRSIDESISYINTQLQQSNNPTLQSIVAVKENVAGTEKVKFLSTLGSFKISVGTNANGTGFGSQGLTDASTLAAGGSTADISAQGSAVNAVSALSSAVSALGKAQAVVGRGQNQFNYAINLAQSQLSNLAAAESRIRDADLAAEAANLTKSQILLQAGIAALAQANSAPQQVLSLLRG